MKKITVFSLLLVFSCAGPSKVEVIEAEDPHPYWSEVSESERYQVDNKFVIYQVLPRLFGNTLTTNQLYGTSEVNGVGKFNDFTDTALAGIKSLGVTHVWYTGVLRHATMDDFTRFGIPQDDSDVVKGRAGSPYAIVDYYDVAPSLAVDVRNRMREFEALVARTHAQGLKVLIDFVPNHVARGYRSLAKPANVRDLGQNDDSTLAFSVNNNFYYIPATPFQVPRYNPLGPDIIANLEDGLWTENPAKVTGNDVNRPDPNKDTWFETVKLNYGVDMFQGPRHNFFDPVPSTWVKMKDILLYWVAKGVDGFRCDMAEMVPAEFWTWAIPLIKQRNPQVLFIAEIYNPAAYANYHTAGFDFLYDKVGLYDKLKPLLSNKANPGNLTNYWQNLPVPSSIMLSFLENHDEVRVASSSFAGDPQPGLAGMALSAFLGSGPVMIYAGQEVGEPGSGREGFQGEDGRTTIFDYWGVPQLQKWVNNKTFDGGGLTDEEKLLRADYTSILTLARTNEAIRRGTFYDLDWYNRGRDGYSVRSYSFMRVSPNQSLLAVFHFSPEGSDMNLRLPPGAWARLEKENTVNFTLTDMKTKEVFSGSSGTVTIPMTSYGYRLLSFSFIES